MMRCLKKILLGVEYVLIALLIIAALLTICIVRENLMVETVHYNIYSDKVRVLFDGFKIVQISDFHSSSNGEKVLKQTAAAKPDIIVITGDLVNKNDTDFSNAQALVEGLCKIAPTYFVSGNHEKWNVNEKGILEMVEKAGATVMNDRIERIFHRAQSINLIGYDDSEFDDSVMQFAKLSESLSALYAQVEQRDAFNILLFHRANWADYAAKPPIDLILSGHVHGGQIGIPVVRDAIAKVMLGGSPYYEGIYRKNGVQIVVSTGLENTLTRPRLLNPPQVVVITLCELD